ncbi:hypothetical protein ACFX13_038424 [Malus domestica]
MRAEALAARKYVVSSEQVVGLARKGSVGSFLPVDHVLKQALVDGHNFLQVGVVDDVPVNFRRQTGELRGGMNGDWVTSHTTFNDAAGVNSVPEIEFRRERRVMMKGNEKLQNLDKQKKC